MRRLPAALSSTWCVPASGVEGLGERLHHEHHPRPAAEGRIVDLAMHVPFPNRRRSTSSTVSRPSVIARPTRLVSSGDAKNSGNSVTTVMRTR